MIPENTGGGEMKTLLNVKDEVAQDFTYGNWDDAYRWDGITNSMIDEVAKRYAAEAIKGFAKCIKRVVTQEGEHREWLIDIEKCNKFLKDYNLINELK